MPGVLALPECLNAKLVKLPMTLLFRDRQRQRQRQTETAPGVSVYNILHTWMYLVCPHYQALSSTVLTQPLTKAKLRKIRLTVSVSAILLRLKCYCAYPVVDRT